MSANAKPRPKPWEAHAPLDSSPSLDASTAGNTPAGISDNSTEDQSSGNPPRPVGLTSDPATTYRSSPYGGGGLNGGMYGNSMMGGGLYGGSSMYGGGGQYGSLYGGGMGPMYGGGYGGGSMYGNGYGGYMNGSFPGGPGGLGESTQATFQLIESLIGTVAGFAQMLESTYMATHNSFFSMISVAEQFSYLKEILGSFFGIFAMMKIVKKVLYYATRGRLGTPPRSTTTNGKHENKSHMLEEFERFKSNGNPEGRKRKKISWKPLIFFLAAVFGFPYALNKFISRVQSMQRGRIGSPANQQVDPSRLEFARALYDFIPENPQIEATLKKGDLMAIISRQDPSGRDSEWWKVRTKVGNIGYVPYNYIEIIKRQKKIEDIPEHEQQL